MQAASKREVACAIGRNESQQLVNELTDHQLENRIHSAHVTPRVLHEVSDRPVGFQVLRALQHEGLADAHDLLAAPLAALDDDPALRDVDERACFVSSFYWFVCSALGLLFVCDSKITACNCLF